MRGALIAALTILAVAPAWAQDEESEPPAAPAQPQVGPPPSDTMFEARIRASVAAAQALQGPLDGRWTLRDSGGGTLYVFKFIDPASGRGPLEGAWRDPRRPRASGEIGVIDLMQLTENGLSLTFTPRSGGQPTSIRLQGDPGAGWSGEMTENGAIQTVTLRRSWP